jgi:hypothetical protein
MSDQFWLTKAQLKRIEPFFPRTRGIPRRSCIFSHVSMNAARSPKRQLESRPAKSPRIPVDDRTRIATTVTADAGACNAARCYNGRTSG